MSIDELYIYLLLRIILLKNKCTGLVIRCFLKIKLKKSSNLHYKKLILHYEKFNAKNSCSSPL